MIKKYKKLSLFILLLTVLLIVGGVAYAFFQEDLYTNTVSFNGGSIKINFNQNSENLVLLENFPMTEDEVLEHDNPILFSLQLTNTTNKYINYNINLLNGEDIEGYSRFSNTEITYALYRNDVYLAHGDLNSLKNNSMFNDYIKPNTNNEEVNYKLYLFINDTVSIGNNNTYTLDEFGRKYANFNIQIVSSDNNALTLYDLMRINSESDSNINYSAINGVSEGGLYKLRGTENDHFPVYFYRGDINNNYAVYNGKCYKIIRTTENGGIRIAPYSLEYSYGGCNEQRNSSLTQTSAPYNSNSSTTEPPSVVSYYTENYVSSMEPVSNRLGIYAGTDITFNGSSYSLVNYITNPQVSDLQTHPFMADSKTGITSNIYYAYYVDLSSSKAYFVPFNSTEKYETVMDKLLNGGNLSIPSPAANVLDDNDYYEAITSLLDDSAYCNDKSLYNPYGFSKTGTRTSHPVYNTKYRMTTSNIAPSFTCSNKDRYTTSKFSGNGALTYKKGLPTVDELKLAGGKLNTANDHFYLYNSTGNIHTMSPASKDSNFISYIYYLASNGAIQEGNTETSRKIQYFYTIKHNTLVLKGDGTANNPYLLG